MPQPLPVPTSYGGTRTIINFFSGLGTLCLFLLIAWITPVMTTAHLLLSVGLTVYIVIGSWLKDRRLTLYIGDEYRAYMAEVPGFPLVRFGPLGVVRVNAGH